MGTQMAESLEVEDRVQSISLGPRQSLGTSPHASTRGSQAWRQAIQRRAVRMVFSGRRRKDQMRCPTELLHLPTTET